MMSVGHAYLNNALPRTSKDYTGQPSNNSVDGAPISRLRYRGSGSDSGCAVIGTGSLQTYILNVKKAYVAYLYSLMDKPSMVASRAV